MQVIFYILILLLGLALGSFIAAWVSRAHREVSVWYGRSACVSCQYTLQTVDLIPVVSFFLLKGKCRKCFTKISSHYFLTELFFMFGFLFLAWFGDASFFHITPTFIFHSIALFFLTAVFVSDFLYQEIPFSMTIPPAVLFFILSFVWSQGDWKNMARGAILASGFFLIQYLVSKGKWIGFGDVALGVLMGVILGWQKTLLALFFAYVSGAIVSLVLLGLKKGDRKTALPFGVFLSVATLIAMLLGEKIIIWYLGLI